MTFWPRKLLPRTLGAQLVFVAATAVIVSNAAVGIWFATNQERMTQSYLTGRLLDRAVSAATLLSGIAAREREAAVKTMSSGPWRFWLIYGKAAEHPMTDEEAAYADRVRRLLPPPKAKLPVSVSILRGVIHSSTQPDFPRSGTIVEVTLPVVRRVQLVTAFSPPASTTA